MATVYSVAGLVKQYPGSKHPANDDLTFEIAQGELFGLLGPNGAGKSTLVNQLAGLSKPTAGSIQLYGMDVGKNPQIVPEYVALQPQQSMALFDLYPQEAIYYTGRFRGMERHASRLATDELMEELRLDRLRSKRISRLSGGERKLVTLAVAFIANRPVQIFDEPTNDLDPQVRRLVWDKLLSLSQQGTTIVLVTHNVAEAERVIRRVGIINEGRLVAIGTPGELKARVDQRVSLELLFKSSANSFVHILKDLGEVKMLSSQHWRVLCSRNNSREAIDRVLEVVGLDRLDDFRITTPTLEDVYLQLGGGTRLE